MRNRLHCLPQNVTRPAISYRGILSQFIVDATENSGAGNTIENSLYWFWTATNDWWCIFWFLCCFASFAFPRIACTFRPLQSWQFVVLSTRCWHIYIGADAVIVLAIRAAASRVSLFQKGTVPIRHVCSCKGSDSLRNSNDLHHKISMDRPWLLFPHQLKERISKKHA